MPKKEFPLGFEDTQQSGYETTISLQRVGTGKVFISSFITQPKQDCEYYYIKKTSIKKGKKYLDPPEDQYSWEKTKNHQQKYLTQRKKRRLEGHRNLKQDPGNIDRSEFRNKNAVIEKRFQCVYKNSVIQCSASKYTSVGLPVNFPNKSKKEKYKLFHVVYDNTAHNHLILDPPRRQNSDENEYGIDLTCIPEDDNESCNDSHNEPEDISSDESEEELEEEVGNEDSNNIDTTQEVSDHSNEDTKKRRKISFESEKSDLCTEETETVNYEEEMDVESNQQSSNKQISEDGGQDYSNSFVCDFDLNYEEKKMEKDSFKLLEENTNCEYYLINSSFKVRININGSGERSGVVCLSESIPANTNIGRYPGKFISRKVMIKNGFVRSPNALDIGRKEEIGLLDPGVHPLRSNILPSIKSAEYEDEINVLPFLIKHNERTFVHFITTREIKLGEELKGFFGPRKTLMELHKPLINFYMILNKKFDLKLCADIEREYKQKNPTYEPLYMKYFSPDWTDEGTNNQAQEAAQPIQIKKKSTNILKTSTEKRKGGIRTYLFDIKQSKIPNAGEGVFVTKEIPEGTAFGPYPGWKLEYEKYMSSRAKLPDTGYDMEVQNEFGDVTHVLCNDPGFDPTYKTNWLAKINHNIKKSKINLRLRTFFTKGDVYIESTKTISPHEELHYDYGDMFNNKFISEHVEQDVLRKKEDKNSRSKKNIATGH